MLRRLDHPLKTVLQEKSDETASTERSRDREALGSRAQNFPETAKLMGCSEGSVKTHCSRAASALVESLKKQGFKP